MTIMENTTAKIAIELGASKDVKDDSAIRYSNSSVAISAICTG